MSELPENWQDCELGDLAQTIKNGFVSQQNRDGVGFPITRIETIANGTIDENRLGFVSGITLESIQDYALIENDILFSHINSPSHLGKTALYRGRPNPLYHGMNLLLIRADEAVVNPRYLEYGLKFLRSQGVFSLNAQHAVNQASINQKKLKAMRLPLAPLAEQKRIADKLDALLARVDRCRIRLDRVPLILKRFRQAVLAAATSGQLTEEWREAHGGDIDAQTLMSFIAEEKINWAKDNPDHNEASRVARRGHSFDAKKLDSNGLPEGWCWAQLEDVFLMLVDCHNKTAPYSQTGIPLVRTSNIKDGRLIWDDMRFITDATYLYWSRRCPPEPGDIVFTREAPMSEATMIPPNTKICLGQRTMLFRPVNRLTNINYP